MKLLRLLGVLLCSLLDERIELIAAEQRSALFGCEGCSPIT